VTPADTARVLAKLAAYDQRTVGHADVAAWHEIIGHLDLDCCLAAVAIHYRESTSRVMPSEIRKLATDIRVRTRAVEERRQRQLEANPHPTRTGADMVRHVLARLKDAGQDVNNGKLLGRQRAGDIAEQAVAEWLRKNPDPRYAEETQ
jgi:hypothetical protein